MKNIGIWIRVSTEDQAQGESPQNHEQRARMYADIKEWRVVEVYNLAGVSGKSVLGHSEAKRMLSDIASGKIQGLIFSKLARLARNTTELLQIAEYFKQHNADLVSIQENIDTSSPAGRLLYTMIAALAEWEREEIASRVKASVKTRAKQGKSLGGSAPYGYQWVNKELQLNLDEAPVRKKMFELYKEHRRVKTVTKLINELGYTTRKGKPFASNSVKRLLSDTIAKGIRRVNYTQSTGDNKQWIIKDEEEWEFVQVPAIVSKELFDECKRIMDASATTRKQVKQIFSGFMFCHCGSKMYVKYGGKIEKKYVCNNCKNNITTSNAEMIFKEYLQDFLSDEKELKQYFDEYTQGILSLKEEAKHIEQQLEKYNIKLQSIMELYQDGQIRKKDFSNHYNPIVEQTEKLEIGLTKLQAEISVKEEALLSSDKVLGDARNLYGMWDKLTLKEKRVLVENMLHRFTIEKESIEIILNYIPTTHPSLNSLENGDTPLSLWLF